MALILASSVQTGFHLLPLDNVEACSDPAFEWRATSHDPQFLVSKAEAMAGRWLRIEAHLRTDQDTSDPLVLYFDIGQGFSEESSLRLYTDDRGGLKCLWRAPTSLRRIRLDPMAQAGKFSLRFIVKPVSWFTVIKLALTTIGMLAAKASKRIGGPQQIVAAAIGVYRREGFAGVVQSFKQARKTAREILLYGNTLDYEEWIRRYDSLSSETRSKIQQRIENLAHKPTISILMRCCNPKADWLREAIESVHHQLYPFWELCIDAHASTDPVIRSILDSEMERDARVKVAYHSTSGEAGAVRPSVITKATGEYIALLDAEDLLAEYALFAVVESASAHTNAGLIYSDEDKISPTRHRFDPHFKCDWNYDLFLSMNMVGHLAVYRSDLFRILGGFRNGLGEAREWDLALRCIERLDPKEIVHIPRVLYHCRADRARVETERKEAKPNPSALRVLNEHLERKGVSGSAERIPNSDAYRIRYTLPESPPCVTLVIPTRNGFELISRCISSILEKTDYPNYEILIVDNGSDDVHLLSWFKSLKNERRIRVLRDDRPFNYSALNNRAVREAHGEFVGLVNNDIEVINREWLSEMMSMALQPGVGAVGSRLWYPNDTLQHGGVYLSTPHIGGHCHKHFLRGHGGYFHRAIVQQSFSAVTAACLVVRRSTFVDVGGLDEDHLKVTFNDVDFCLRLVQAGYRNVWTPYAELYHHESASRGHEDTPEKQARAAQEAQYMRTKWGKMLANDPAYSPNLTMYLEDFSYAWPPRVAEW